MPNDNCQITNGKFRNRSRPEAVNGYGKWTAYSRVPELSWCERDSNRRFSEGVTRSMLGKDSQATGPLALHVAANAFQLLFQDIESVDNLDIDG